MIGLETGSVRIAKQIMPSKGVPFPIEEWPSVFLRGMEILNRNNWFPAVTSIVGSPGETDDDVKATLDLIYEVERRGLFAFFIPSIFTPLHDTRMEKKEGACETRQLTRLQWQLMMKVGGRLWFGDLAQWRCGCGNCGSRGGQTSRGRCSTSPALYPGNGWRRWGRCMSASLWR